MKENLVAINYPLPEDIEKLKWYGDFDACIDLIDYRLTQDIPEVLKEKLRMERHQILRMRRNYTVTEEEAQKIMAENLRDYRPEELAELKRDNFVDWIFVNGEIRYIDSFYRNLVKIRKDIADRQLHPEPEPEKTTAAYRREMIARMKEKGEGRCRFHIRSTVEITRDTIGENEKYYIYVASPLEKIQMNNLRIISCNPEPARIPESTDLHPAVYFEGSYKRVKKCDIEYEVEVVAPYVDPRPEQVDEIQPDFYLEEQEPHIVFTPYLKALTREVVGEETNPLLKARRIYNFITTKVNYSFMRSYVALPNIAEYCASRLRGDCGVQAILFITMCRIAGVPARWQSGMYADPNGTGSHDWAMFYVAPYGWLWADPSFGGGALRDGDEERWNFYFGNLEPFRIVLTDGFQQPFVPAMHTMRTDPYDNQAGEAESSVGAIPLDSWDGYSEIVTCEILDE